MCIYIYLDATCRVWLQQHDTSPLLIHIDANACQCYIHLHRIRMVNDLLRTKLTWHMAEGIGHQH